MDETLWRKKNFKKIAEVTRVNVLMASYIRRQMLRCLLADSLQKVTQCLLKKKIKNPCPTKKAVYAGDGGRWESARQIIQAVHTRATTLPNERKI